MEWATATLLDWLTGRFDPCSPKEFEYIQSFSKSKGLFFFLGEIDMSYNNEEPLSKEELYEVYTKNIQYANYQLSVIKTEARQVAVKYYWYCEEKGIERRDIFSNLEALTNLYAYILGSRFELQLMKILHENSSVAFTEEELRNIKCKHTIYDRWSECLNISFDKSSVDWEDISGENLKEIFQDRQNYLKEFQDIITMRNRLAHGQWSVQMDSAGTKEKVPDAMLRYSDLSKLVLLANKLDIMSRIVETIVVYKDKESTEFKQKLVSLIRENQNYDVRIERTNLRQYIDSKLKKYKQEKFQKRGS